MKIKKLSAMLVGMIALCGGVEAIASDSYHSVQHPDAKSGKGSEGIYARICGYCHGANVGPVILGKKLPVDTIKVMVRAGRGSMPAFRQTEISDAELGALARSISESAPNPKDKGK